MKCLEKLLTIFFKNLPGNVLGNLLILKVRGALSRGASPRSLRRTVSPPVSGHSGQGGPQEAASSWCDSPLHLLGWRQCGCLVASSAASPDAPAPACAPQGYAWAEPHSLSVSYKNRVFRLFSQGRIGPWRLWGGIKEAMNFLFVICILWSLLIWNRRGGYLSGRPSQTVQRCNMQSDMKTSLQSRLLIMNMMTCI